MLCCEKNLVIEIKNGQRVVFYTTVQSHTYLIPAYQIPFEFGQVLLNILISI